MIQTRQLIEEAGEALGGGRMVALATVVAVDGSAYRREGAKLLVHEDGIPVGIISGGCLEGEVATIAGEVFEQGRPRRESFDLREDAIFGLGSGCGGVVDVFIEPLSEDDAFRSWSGAVLERRRVVRALITASERDDVALGASLVVAAGERPVGDLGPRDLTTTVAETAAELLAQRNPQTFARILDRVEVLLDVSVPPPELVLFGAGVDAQPVAELARRCGFVITVVDPRKAFLSEGRFPEVERILAHPSGFAERVQLGGNSSVVIMNHHYERDRHSLRFALEMGVPYVGVLGPTHRFKKLLAELAEEGFTPSPEQLERVHNPVGLDIGAEGPEEIAVSIVAEVLAALRGVRGEMLREAAD